MIRSATPVHPPKQTTPPLVYHRITKKNLLQAPRLDDPDRIFAEGGAQEAVLAARKARKIRHIGFTGHKDPMVHLRMLETASQHGFHFDAVQMPLNVMDAHFRSFQHQVLPVLVKQQTAVLGMKTFGDNFILKSKTVTPIEALHYSMSLPTCSGHHRD